MSSTGRAGTARCARTSRIKTLIPGSLCTKKSRRLIFWAEAGDNAHNTKPATAALAKRVLIHSLRSQVWI
jgi:hypothetical protein